MAVLSPAWLVAFVALITLVGGIVGWIVRKLLKIFSRTTQFLDDYFGEPSRPGVPERKGVMARLHDVELQVAASVKASQEVLAETKPNKGHSLRDVVHRTSTDVTTVKQQVGELQKRVEEIERGRERREQNPT